MENPFNYLQFATGDRFYDREDIRKDLRSRFLSGQTNVVLYGPRRYGKSSLVAELTADLEAAGIPCITLDVVKVPSIDLFVSAYAQKVYRRLAPVKFELRRLGDFFKSLRPKLTFGADGEAGISFEALFCSALIVSYCEESSRLFASKAIISSITSSISLFLLFITALTFSGCVLISLMSNIFSPP